MMKTATKDKEKDKGLFNRLFGGLFGRRLQQVRGKYSKNWWKYLNDIPEEINWRTKVKNKPVIKDQKKCASCYTTATTTAIEYAA